MPRLKQSQRVSKRAFVLTLPFDTPAKEVVAKAKEAGLKIKPEYVYVVRSNAKQGKLQKKTATRRGSATLPGSLESEFRRLSIELGMDKSKELLKETERKVADLIRGD